MLNCYKIQNDTLVDVSSTPDSSDIIWYDIYNPELAEERFVESKLTLSIPTREEMQEIELSSRLYAEDSAEFMTMNVVSHAEQEPVRTPVTFIIKGNMLVTVRYDEPKSFTLFKTRAMRAQGVEGQTGPELFLDLLEAVVNRIADLFEKTGADIDLISNKVFRQSRLIKHKNTLNLNDIIGDIGRSGDVITMLQESLTGLTRMLSYHVAVSDHLSKPSLQHIKMLQRDAASMMEHATALSDKITFLLDATMGLINLEQNQIIKMFSVAAVVFLPPTLVASVYGMNFEFMPELKWITGYPFALGLMGVSAIIPYLYAKRRGWL